ncbi:RHS repeat-associated core domain-containing protein [Pseudochryseolinea flava]|uniref:RHS repeat-associated core domain-containing protein n=1 Tax=Pseudochryseolinea flava TaxID=2059302 RepID=A0A364XY82_9BACT|nr:RHS repeat-associated core domain-containing protein [Pseudochryseolinea flava]RAV99271.1 hypothetical protein DQQ10_20480 [Pseudochryseolinea flava]
MNTLVSQIAGGTAPTGTVVDGSGYTNSTESFPFAGGLNGTGDNTDPGPKAYLNWLVYDRDYNLIPSKSGYEPMSTAARETGQNIAHEHLLDSVTISDAGYVYIYLSNEEGENAYEVYFDEFKVEHTKSPVIQMEDYYPFGLTFNSYQRENKLTNDITFQNQERQDELNLGWVQFKWRNAMPDIGRFFNVDPIAEDYYHNSVYAFSENKLISYRELEGLEAQLIIVGVVVAVTVEEVTVAALISGAVVFGDEIVEGLKDIANAPASGTMIATSPASAWNQEAQIWRKMAKASESGSDNTKKKEQLQKNKEQGAKAEEKVKTELKDELKEGQEILVKPRVVTEDGKVTYPDYVTVDTKTKQVVNPVEVKSGNAKLSKGQKSLKQNGGSLQGKQYPEYNGAQIKPNELDVKRQKK